MTHPDLGKPRPLTTPTSRLIIDSVPTTIYYSEIISTQDTDPQKMVIPNQLTAELKDSIK